MSTPELQRPGLHRVVIEGLVIVTSILLAFGIDAWWDRLQEERTFSRTLEGLEAAFSENVAGVGDHLAELETLTSRVAVFLDSSPEELSRLPEDSAHIILIAVNRQGTAALNNEYLTELVDAADLSGYRELDATAALWRRQAFLLRERRAVLVDLAQQLLSEASRYDELRDHLREIEGLHEDVAGLARFRRNSDVVALATLKTQSWATYQVYFREMLEASETLVAMLRDLRAL